MADDDKVLDGNTGTENDPAVDTHVEVRTADSDEDLNRGDQEGPRGARLVPGDRVDEARAFVLAGDVDPEPTPQADGSVARSTLVQTSTRDAAGNPVGVVRVEVIQED